MADSKGTFISKKIITHIDKIIRNKVRFITISGGEPTLHNEFYNFISLFSQYAKVSVISNGSQLYKMPDSRLSLIDGIQFSLYGCSDEEYALRTGIADGYTRLKSSIELIQYYNVPYKIAVTLDKDTIENIQDYIEIAIKLKATSIRLGAADNFGNELTNYRRDLEYESKKERLAEVLLHYKRIYRHAINIQLMNISTEHIAYYHMENKESSYRGLSCKYDSEHIVFSQHGRIRFCECFPETYFVIGDINDFYQQTKGRFNMEEFKNCVRNFYYQANIDSDDVTPCDALKTFYDTYIK